MDAPHGLLHFRCLHGHRAQPLPFSPMRISLNAALLAMARLIGRRVPPLVAASLLCLLSAGLATAQSFPVKALRLILRAPPGGTDDLLGRLVAQKMGDILGQQVIVDYRT